MGKHVNSRDATCAWMLFAHRLHEFIIPLRVSKYGFILGLLPNSAEEGAWRVEIQDDIDHRRSAT